MTDESDCINTIENINLDIKPKLFCKNYVIISAQCSMCKEICVG